MTPELQSKIAEWRAKDAAGQMTVEDYIQVIAALREGRLGAAAASDGAKRKTAKAQIRSADEMLGELMGG